MTSLAEQKLSSSLQESVSVPPTEGPHFRGDMILDQT